MNKLILSVLAVATMLPATNAFAQIKQTREQVMFYTADWKGDRFPDGRPKLPDDLLTRALDVSIEDVWDFLRGQRYNNQFEGDFILLHPDKPFAGRAFTAQYMPSRPDMVKAFSAEGKTENRISWGNNNSWPINELSVGDIYVADGYGKIADGTLIGSNLGNGVAAHTHTGFVFYGGIRDAEENREIANFNGAYKGYDPSDWHEENLTGINVPVRIGRAIVLPGDLILVKQEGMIVIPAPLAEACISSAEFTNLQDAFNFELNQKGANGGQFEGGWTPAKYAAFKRWIDANPSKLKMPRQEFDDMLARHSAPRVRGAGNGAGAAPPGPEAPTGRTPPQP